MKKKHEDIDLNKEVSEIMESWRWRKAVHEGFLKDADRLARKSPFLGSLHLFVIVHSARRGVKDNIRRLYGYKMDSDDAYPAYKDRIINPRLFPSSIKEWKGFNTVRCEWRLWNIACETITPIMDSTSLSEEDTYHQVCGHYRFVMLEMAGPYVAYWMLTEGGRSKRIDVRALTEDQLAWLSAVVGSQISLQRNPRLNYALKKESSSPTSRFLQELPGTTLYEVGNLIRRGDDFSNLYALSNLKKEVAKHLANVGSGTPEMSRDYRLADSNLSEVSTDESVLEELFLAKQELAAARASGKITESEDQVLELRSRDYSEDEIASKLRKGKGTVKTLTYRGRKKLRPAAGQ